MGGALTFTQAFTQFEHATSQVNVYNNGQLSLKLEKHSLAERRLFLENKMQQKSIEALKGPDKELENKTAISF